MLQLVLIALATLISEDLACIGAGALVARGSIGFIPAAAACFAGIFAGDLGLLLAGRLAGTAMLRAPWMRRFVPLGKVETASKWLSERGLAVVLLTRFTPGLRLPTYVAAGILRTRLVAFASFFAVAALVWTPLLVGASVLLGGELLRTIIVRGGEATTAVAVVVAAGFIARKAVGVILRQRTRIITFLLRKVQWEFWAAWAAYVPLAPWFLFLAIRHRSITLFTAANPAIPTGGLVGESKSEILTALEPAGDFIAPFALIQATRNVYGRVQCARAFLESQNLSYPVVLKPDIGERGSGVAVIRSEAAASDYLAAAKCDTIIQQYIPGIEFGVFWYRFPGEKCGHVFSITEKRLPEVTGDGRSTVQELIMRDDRAHLISRVYLNALGSRRAYVPPTGERVPLVEIGSHCRGAVFLDATHLRTTAIERALDQLGDAFPGFCFGRYDVRAESTENFQAGRFRVLELNGVGAEATHIYDPTVSIRRAYGTMFRQWRLAFEIGDRNRALGFAPTALGALARIIWSRKAHASRPKTRRPAPDIDAGRGCAME